MITAELMEVIKPYTLLSPGRLFNLHHLSGLMNTREVEGDIVECGTCKGGSAAVLGMQLGARKLWLFDSFEGMPPTIEIDGRDAAQCVGLCAASRDEVVEILTKTNLPPEKYLIRAGLFSNSFVDPLPQRVALLHCDADWYDSVMIVLETFYPRMPDGACVVLDDFGYWEGCREAFYDFCARYDEKPLLERLDSDQAWWFKGRKHNRRP